MTWRDDPYDENISPRQRAEIACSLILTGKYRNEDGFTRKFETCLEMHDSEEVWQEICRMVRHDRQLAVILIKGKIFSLSHDLKKACDECLNTEQISLFI
jgi:hypothetical protein